MSERLRKRQSGDQPVSPLLRAIKPTAKKVKLDPQSIDFLLTSPKSKLTEIELKNVINFEMWLRLSEADRDFLIKLLPKVDLTFPTPTTSSNTNPSSADHMDIDGQSKGKPQLSEAFFKSNQFLHRCFEDFQDALYRGYLTPEAVASRKAREANPEQYAGDDTWKDENFEAYWGQKQDQKEKLQAVAGDSRSVNLKEMCLAQLIRKDDVLVYRRNFSAVNVMVDTSMKVVRADGTTGVSIQIGKTFFHDLETPTSLETKILDLDNRVPKDKRPNGNAFKSLKLVRGGDDLGRLFDVRREYFQTK